MKKIKLMADYGCYPLWHVDSDEFGDIAPSSLPISESLQNALMDWANIFDSILDMDDPASSGFKNDQEEKDFIQKGYELSLCLKHELGNTYEVIYKP